MGFINLIYFIYKDIDLLKYNQISINIELEIFMKIYIDEKSIPPTTIKTVCGQRVSQWQRVQLRSVISSKGICFHVDSKEF